MATATTKRDVLNTLRQNSDRLLALGVKRLGLFGSFVREEQRSASDIDLLVEFQPGKKTFDNFMELSFLLEDLFRRRVEPRDHGITEPVPWSAYSARGSICQPCCYVPRT